MSDALARGELLLGLVDVSEQLELFNELLVRRHIHEDRRPPAVLCEEYGPPTALHLPDDARDVGAELGE